MLGRFPQPDPIGLQDDGGPNANVGNDQLNHIESFGPTADSLQATLATASGAARVPETAATTLGTTEGTISGHVDLAQVNPDTRLTPLNGRGGGGTLSVGSSPPPLPPFTPRGATAGVFQTPTLNIPLQSGYRGPASAMPKGSRGFDRMTLGHVEGHAAALMQQNGIREATLYINNPKICASCARLLPRMLPPGSTLNIVLPDGRVVQFKGITP